MPRKLLLVIAMFCASITFASAQSTTDSTRTAPEKAPAFKKGLNGWTSFLERNLDRDLLSRQNAPSGKYTSIASFLVDVDGSVKDIIIESDPGYGTADEFRRILKLSSKNWVPASDKGVAVACRHKQSLTFVN